MYEEFLRQAREFDQSVWGGLFRFLVGLVFAVNSLVWPKQNWRLWLAIMWLVVAGGWTIDLFIRGHTLLGGILGIITLVGVGRTVSVESHRRRQKA